MRTHLLVLGSSREWTEFTLSSPATSTIAAALGLGSQVAVGGGHLAHSLQHFSEAETLAGIWERKRERKVVMETVPVLDMTRQPESSKCTGWRGNPGLSASRRAWGPIAGDGMRQQLCSSGDSGKPVLKDLADPSPALLGPGQDCPLQISSAWPNLT